MTTSHSTNSSAKKYGGSALGLVLSTAIGAGLGLLFAPREGSATRKQLYNKVKDIAHHFSKTREQVQESVKDIWGEVTEELEKDYVEVRSHILAAAEDLHEEKNLSKSRFNEIISDTVDQFSKGKEWTRDQKNSLMHHLKEEWEGIKEKFTQEKEETTA